MGNYYLKNEENKYIAKAHGIWGYSVDLTSANGFRNSSVALNSFFSGVIPETITLRHTFSLVMVESMDMVIVPICSGLRYEMTYEEAKEIVGGIAFSADTFVQRENRKRKEKLKQAQIIDAESEKNEKPLYLDEMDDLPKDHSKLYFFQSSNFDKESKLIESFVDVVENYIEAAHALNKLPSLEELNIDLNIASREMIDILHYIEFTKFNAADGYKALALLQKKLLDRRAIKDKIDIRSEIDKLASGLSNLQDLENTIKLDKRNYVPRINAKIFQNGV